MKGKSDSKGFDAEVIVIGAGPFSLTFVCFALFESNYQMKGKIKVVDPEGSWMVRWRNQFESQEIPYLRSPVIYNPHRDTFSLFEFYDSNKHTYKDNGLLDPDDKFLDKYVNNGDINLGVTSFMFKRPSSDLFVDFTEHIINMYDLDDIVIQNKVTSIEALPDGKLKVHLENGQPLIALNVVYAGGNPLPNIPDWATKYYKNIHSDKLSYFTDIILPDFGQELENERILIVGGGLSSGHFSIGACKRNADVTLVSRRKIDRKQFDIPPLQRGKFGREFLKEFLSKDFKERFSLLKRLNPGGSMTPEVYDEVRRLAEENILKIKEEVKIVDARYHDNAWTVKFSDDTECQYDRIWLATGMKVDFNQERIFQQILKSHPCPIYSGIPQLDENLKMPGVNVYIMGRYAAYSVGPEAFNLGGARLEAMKIVPQILGYCKIDCEEVTNAKQRRKDKREAMRHL